MHAQSCLTLYDPMDQAPISMGSSRQEYWSGLSFPFPGDLHNPGVKRLLPLLSWPEDFFTTAPLGKPNTLVERLYEQYSLISFNSLSSFFRGKKT